MSDYHDRLIDVYANNPVSGIDAVPAYQQLCAEFAQNPYFLSDRHATEKAKVQVEAALDAAATQQEGVQKAIQFLFQTKGDEKKRALCHELIAVGYRPQWSAAQQDYFDAAWTKVQLKYDFFLSFTSRFSAAVVGDNPVNRIYKQFIVSVIGIDSFNSADRRTKNLLAEAVKSLLCEQGDLEGFYYPHQQADNAVTERKLEEACDQSLVFVQLVQSIMFARPAGPSSVNYCHFEWQRIKNQFAGEEGERRILFVGAESDRNVLTGLLPFVDYTDWHKHVCDKDMPYIPQVPVPDDAKQTEIQGILKKRIAAEIRRARYRLIDGAPA